jgi:pimeloyl-ACP methyl ester carboxylesterase
MNGLGITEVVDYYDSIIRGLDTPPVIMGHSFGGLITELLLDRGPGAAAVAISPAQIKGVLRLPPAQIRTVWPALRNPANSKKTVPLTPKQFHFRFTNTMNDADARAAYDRYYVPGPGRVLFQAGSASRRRSWSTRSSRDAPTSLPAHPAGKQWPTTRSTGRTAT